MANELTESQLDLAAALASSVPDKLFEPLIQKIFLMETTVAGTSHLPDQAILEKLGPDMVVQLRREPDNPFDPLAVRVQMHGQKIGCLPQADNEVISRLLDAGKEVEAQVCEIGRRGKHRDIWIRISLIEL